MSLQNQEDQQWGRQAKRFLPKFYPEIWLPPYLNCSKNHLLLVSQGQNGKTLLTCFIVLVLTLLPIPPNGKSGQFGKVPPRA